MPNDPYSTLPGKMGEAVRELQAMVKVAESASAVVPIDRSAQRLMDDLRGNFGDEVAAKFVLPTIDVMVEMGLASPIDWDAGNKLTEKVNSYIVLAEDFGLTAEQLEGIELLVTGWHELKPKPDRAQKERQTPAAQADIPFALRVSYKGVTVIATGQRSGETYWAQMWSKVHTHFKGLDGHQEGFSPEIKEAIKDAKVKLLEGAKSVQVWDYIVDREN